MTSIHDLGDEGLGRLYGPNRVAFWFDEQDDYRSNNERFWSIRRALIYSDIWDDYDIVSVPVVPEWFGMLLPLERAYRETGHPCIWCVMLGFPTSSLRDKALKIAESAEPSGLVKVEKQPPEPGEYSLPLVGFLAKRIYLTLEPSYQRSYDSWEGYETLGLVDEAEGLGMEAIEADLAEKMFLRRLALNTGRRLEPPEESSDIEGLVEHARELWAADAIAASGAVAGTAMERLLAESLPVAERDWAEGATLAPLIDKTAKHHDIAEEQRELLHAFRKLRNECAHALSDSDGDGSDGQLAARIHSWLAWLEDQDFENIAGAEPRLIDVPRERPDPSQLHAEADAAGRAAAEAAVPVPMRVSSPGGEEVVPDGVCGNALVMITPASDPLATWLVSEGHAFKAKRAVKMSVPLKTQSMARAAAYARAYVDVLLEVNVSARYETHMT